MKYVPNQDTEFQLDRLLNEGLELNDNFRGALLEIDLSEGENTVRHGLGFKPYGFILLVKDGPGEVYGTRLSEWTNELLYCGCDATSLKVRLFVL